MSKYGETARVDDKAYCLFESSDTVCLYTAFSATFVDTLPLLRETLRSFAAEFDLEYVLAENKQVAKALEDLTRLHTLKLQGVEPGVHEIRPEETLHALQHISITSDFGPVSALDLVPRCPNLTTLSYDSTHPCTHFSYPNKAPWPPLRELHLGSDTHVLLPKMQPAPRIVSVHRLTINASTLSAAFLPAPSHYLTALLRSTRPAALLVAGAYTNDAKLSGDPAWAPVLRAEGTRLRSLELAATTLSAIEPAVLVSAFVGLPLVYLGWTQTGHAHPGRDCLPLEPARVRTAHTLSTLLVDALPALCVLKVGCMFSASVVEDAEDGELRERLSLAGDEAPARGELQEFRGVQRGVRWWIVKRGGDGRKMVEVWREVGERAKEVVESDGFDPESSALDEFFVPRNVYQL
ncbi:uncharacterized protein BXZ73DRAFT_100647 [Epithele typhae]|uniref:uncharacterized protein n=1 Tax=Epithele typhae TaxID=378194 RepID=UPI0020081C4B|nr:uncharacterized protein BXZ73DRAFT_100647 [Epithele typhae]KAH9934456.1 hypothetical protein BXZ73DRAFT_100647 [Epithele typhae]